MRIPMPFLRRGLAPPQPFTTTSTTRPLALVLCQRTRLVVPLRNWSSSNSHVVTITKTKPTDELRSPSVPNIKKDTAPTDESPSTTTATANRTSDQKAVVQITASCWNRIHTLVTSKKKQKQKDNSNHLDDDYYLRLFVDAGGCSGFSYQFELDDTPLAPDDVVFEPPHTAAENNNNNNNKSRLVIDEASLEMLQGSTIDYVQEMIKSSFQVTNNPQSESACGCGSSFALKNFTSNPAID